jgi:hypothetical protein
VTAERSCRASSHSKVRPRERPGCPTTRTTRGGLSPPLDRSREATAEDTPLGTQDYAPWKKAGARAAGNHEIEGQRQSNAEIEMQRQRRTPALKGLRQNKLYDLVGWTSESVREFKDGLGGPSYSILHKLF